MIAWQAFALTYGYGKGDSTSAIVLRASSYMPIFSIVTGIFMTTMYSLGATNHPDGGKAFLSRAIINLTGLGIFLLPVDLFATAIRCYLV